MTTVLYNCDIVRPDERFMGWVVIKDGKIVRVERGRLETGHGELGIGNRELGKGEGNRELEKVDFGGDMLLPGIVDTHVHFREPGLTHKADIASESAAALAGGVTTVLDMPNTNPATVSVEAWRAKRQRGAETSHVDFNCFIGATNSNIDELLAMEYLPGRDSDTEFMGAPGVKLFLGSSTGNMLVEREGMLERLFAEVKAPIAVHAEDEATVRANTEAAKRELGEAFGSAAPEMLAWHPRIRSAEACVKATRRALDLAARHPGARLHVCHLSTAGEAAMFAPGDIAAKRVTAETCPHYLLFPDGEVDADGFMYGDARRKCNPAIKGVTDRDGLRRAVEEGRIDVIATDHAPHLLSEKEGGVLTAPSGMPGVQFSLVLMLAMSREGRGDIDIAASDVVRLMSSNPARLYGLTDRGDIAPGLRADLVRVRRREEPRTITDAEVVGKCGWTPYAGQEVWHTVEQVWQSGQ